MTRPFDPDPSPSANIPTNRVAVRSTGLKNHSGPRGARRGHQCMLPSPLGMTVPKNRPVIDQEKPPRRRGGSKLRCHRLLFLDPFGEGA